MIRPYKISDREKVLHLLQLNIPKYFAQEEVDDFKEYLDEKLDLYFVVEKDELIIGCGGINYTEDPVVARISWDVIHPDFQGQGIGKQITQFRINEIKKMDGIKTIVVRTSQHAFLFYKKNGFQLKSTEKDFWAKGIDLYYMTMEVDR